MQLGMRADGKTHSQRLLRAVVNVLQMLVHILNALVKVGLVEPVQIGQVDLEPAQATLAEGPGFGKLEQATTEIVADVVEMRGDGVRPPTEVEIVREVDGVAQELAG